MRKGISMTYEIPIKSPTQIAATGRPFLTSYDSGYEHSLEHWIDLQHRVEEADKDPLPVPTQFAFATEVMVS
jgi:hypothetical protein